MRHEMPAHQELEHFLDEYLAAAGIRDGVQVNVINPGTIRTDRYHKRLAALARERGLDTAAAEREFVRDHHITRIGEPEDIADHILFLACDGARMITGVALTVDGGVLVKNDTPYEEYFRPR